MDQFDIGDFVVSTIAPEVRTVITFIRDEVATCTYFNKMTMTFEKVELPFACLIMSSDQEPVEEQSSEPKQNTFKR